MPARRSNTIRTIFNKKKKNWSKRSVSIAFVIIISSSRAHGHFSVKMTLICKVKKKVSKKNNQPTSPPRVTDNNTAAQVQSTSAAVIEKFR